MGFPDKAFVVPNWMNRNELTHDSASATLDLAKTHGPESIRNPHFTLHPPGHFHLKSENGTVLCEALVWTEPPPGQDVSPWLRFVSNPIATLPPFKRPAHGRAARIYTLTPRREDSSAAIHIDFVRSSSTTHLADEKVAHYFTWGEVTVRVLAFHVDAQAAELGYEIAG